MLLIVILGLMAKLMSVYGDCDIGTQLVNDFDWNKFTGVWYDRIHTSNDIENNFDCAEFTVGKPEGISSLVTTNIYDIRKQRHITTYGNATNWSSNGYYDLSHEVSPWNGRFYVIAVDYDSYFILKTCRVNSNEASVYAGFRQSHPDKATVDEAVKVMQANNIDVSQLVEWKSDHCQKA